jgi:hypothetical protein
MNSIQYIFKQFEKIRKGCPRKWLTFTDEKHVCPVPALATASMMRGPSSHGFLLSTRSVKDNTFLEIFSF